MDYAKLAQDGTVEQYPYSLTQLKLDNPNVSFTTSYDDNTLLAFNVVPVVSVTKPPFIYDKNLIVTAVEAEGGGYVQVWSYEDADPADVVQRTIDESSIVRAQRNNLLSTSDWTQLPDSPVDSVTWATYRQELRDVPQQAGFPWTVTWPTAPA